DAPAQAGTQYSGGWPDTDPVELGVKFRSTVDGYITGIRFYKGSNNTGVHIGNLWSSTGVNLARATFSNETASGWQEVSFSAPVAITAGVTYVASYHTNTGYYVSDAAYLTTRHNGDYVYALADGEDGVNALYSYSSNTAFPTQPAGGGNFWVDVVFSNSAPSNITLTSLNRIKDAGEAFKVSVFPNPANNRTSVSFTSPKENKYVLEITDSYGKHVLRKRGFAKPGNNTEDINLSGKASGLYYITITYKDGEHKTVKLIKTD
ncbi:MAG: DUF4082 domain-containing protein, partial [Ilyomonas sp.]